MIMVRVVPVRVCLSGLAFAQGPGGKIALAFILHMYLMMLKESVLAFEDFFVSGSPNCVLIFNDTFLCLPFCCLWFEKKGLDILRNNNIVMHFPYNNCFGFNGICTIILYHLIGNLSSGIKIL